MIFIWELYVCFENGAVQDLGGVVSGIPVRETGVADTPSSSQSSSSVQNCPVFSTSLVSYENPSTFVHYNHNRWVWNPSGCILLCITQKTFSFSMLVSKGKARPRRSRSSEMKVGESSCAESHFPPTFALNLNTTGYTDYCPPILSIT